MPSDDISGFIIAGGRGRRMGQDKARITWGDRSLLAHAVGRMQQVVHSVFVVGLSGDSPVPVVPDIFAGQGPLAGVHAALTHSATDWILVLAVDMPLATASLLRFVAAQCSQKFLAVIPGATNACAKPGAAFAPAEVFLQPLCAAYHRKLLPVVEQALRNQELSIHRLLERLPEGIMNEQSSALRVIGEQELAGAGFSGEMLLNVNTPSDLEHARALARTLNV